MDRVLLSDPKIRVFIQWVLLAGTGAAGIVLSWSRLPYFPATNIIGGMLCLAAIAFHGYCERAHKEAHQKSQNITRIITDSIYSRIRHPLYLSSILMNVGFALAVGIVWTLILASLFSALVLFVAIKEESFLLAKFESEYRDYMRKVPWRMIPGVF